MQQPPLHVSVPAAAAAGVSMAPAPNISASPGPSPVLHAHGSVSRASNGRQSHAVEATVHLHQLALTQDVSRSLRSPEDEEGDDGLRPHSAASAYSYRPQPEYSSFSIMDAQHKSS